MVLGVNRVGMQRKGFDEARVRAVSAAMRIVLRSGLNTGQAMERIAAEMPDNEDIAYLVEFVRSARRGVIRSRPGGRGNEDDVAAD